jgi:O-antigen/teichoic acid export membrane protein
MSKKYKKLLDNTKLFSIGSIGSKLIVFLMIPIYARVFTQEEFGMIDIFQSLLSLIMPLIILEMVQAVFRFSMEASNKESLRQIFTNGIIFSLSAAMVFSLLLYFLPVFLEFQNYKIFFILVFFSQVTLQTIKIFYQGINEVRKFIVLEFIQVISFVTLNIVFLVIYEIGIFGFFFALFISQVITVIYAIFGNRLYHYYSYREFNYNMFKKMIGYSIPLIPNSMLAWVIASSDKYMLMYMNDMASVGIYAMAVKFPLLVLLIFGIFLQAWQISLTKNFSEKDLTLFISKIFSTVSSLLIILVSVLILINKPLLHFVLSDQFFIAYKYIPWLLLAILFKSFSSFLGVGYIASKKTKGAMYTTIIAAVLNIILNIILIPIYSINGAVFATLISYGVLFLIRMRVTRQFFIVEYKYLTIISSIILLTIQSIVSLKNYSYGYIINFILMLLILMIHKDSLSVKDAKVFLSFKK